MKRSTIGWTDFSGGELNFVIGCTPVSEGCSHCYARAVVEDRGGRDFSKVTIYPGKLRGLRTAWFTVRDGEYRRGAGTRPMAFVVDLGDLFHPDVPDAFIAEAREALAGRDDVDWQILTKRPERLKELRFSGNVWLGVTVEGPRYLGRIDQLRQIPAKVKFVSFEPLLERVTPDLRGISWVIVGGESGVDRRPFDVAWARSLRDQCAEAGIPFFYKQGSDRWPGMDDVLDGQTFKEWPRAAKR